MKVPFGTNVVLDHLLDREPHADNAERLLSLVDRPWAHRRLWTISAGYSQSSMWPATSAWPQS